MATRHGRTWSVMGSIFSDYTMGSVGSAGWMGSTDTTGLMGSIANSNGKRRAMTDLARLSATVRSLSPLRRLIAVALCVFSVSWMSGGQQSCAQMTPAGAAPAGAAPAGAAPNANTAEPSIDFHRQIRPLLAAKCWGCHGADERESGLRLDRRSGLIAGGDSGEPAIVPGKAADSYLLHLVQGREAGKWMPPDEKERLTKPEIALLASWIDQGAPWPALPGETADTVTKKPGKPSQPAPGTSPGGRPSEDAGDDLGRTTSEHWSFQPVRRAAAPPLANAWGGNGIDAHVGRTLQIRGIVPNPPASRADLIRRIYLDLLGLPPSPDDVERFLADDSPAAVANLIERVLASPHYGERWARHWLDLVRFADTNGFETNRERPNAWPFRDYVIRSLNEDKPYDQFLREQLAGDSLGAPVATGFLVAGPYDVVKSPDINLTQMQRQNELDDMIATTGTAFLGLTLGCARCHNHKFDPIRQSEYYAIQAIFAGVRHGDRALPAPPEWKSELDRLQSRAGELRSALSPYVKPGGKRPAVNPRENEERFAPVDAKWVRFTIMAATSAQPCLDEWQIFSGERNVGLATAGAKASCSSSLPGFAIHKLEHIHDGRFGNSHSWISNEVGTGWVKIELPAVTRIDRMLWGRDRDGQYVDRLPTRYRIEVAVEENRWQMVASSDDRQPWGNEPLPVAYRFEGVPADKAQAAQRWLEELRTIDGKLTAQRATEVAYAGVFQPPGPTFRLFRGEPNQPREAVAPNTVAVLGRLAIGETTPEAERRLALADWVGSKQNPLTARVAVNRVWQFHFGQGLVSTPSDFGAAGARPSHPELLDWLAAELMDHGWSLKHLHRLILNSATFQQSGRPRPDALAADGGTETWWRFPPRRLEAEAIRDSILAVTGALDRRMHGPGFSGFEVELENVRHYFPKKQYGPADWRRMVYMNKVRLEKESVFGIFDCPDAATSVPRRGRSTTPLQALNLLNSPFVLQQCELLVQRLTRECGDDPPRRVARAYALCFGRAPDPEETADALAFVSEAGWEAFCRALLNSNEFVFIP